MYFIKTPQILKFFFKDLIWDIPNTDKTVYLTFDDGPTFEVTKWVLETLRSYDAKATFFCIGKNVKENLDIYQMILDEGHSVGNHTFSHINGWKTKSVDYIRDITKAKEWINSNLFRPPYGKIRYDQSKILKTNYKIVMWDMLSGDFDPELDIQNSINKMKTNSKSGSIVTFHDSKKAEKNLKVILPIMLQFWKEQGYQLKAI
jgi:peptidoglycan/xylan/chitin deacetylase (PgdA/CDA1 family)